MARLLDASKVSDGQLYLLRGGSYRALINEIKALRAGDNLEVKGGGILKRPAGDSVALSLLPRTSSSSQSSGESFPFKVYKRANPSNPAGTTFQARVEYNSSLLKDGYILDNRQIITGLSQTNSDGSIAEESWFQYDKGNDLIWLEVTLDNSSIPNAATICSWGLGNSWVPGEGPGPFIGSPGGGSGAWQYQQYFDAIGNAYYQQYVARIQIFSSVTNGSGPAVESQLLNSHLKMCSDVFLGTASDGSTYIAAGLSMPFPYAGPYVAGA